MTLNSAIESFDKLGEELRGYLSGTVPAEGMPWKVSTPVINRWEHVLEEAEKQNGWFTRRNIILSLTNLASWLNRDALVNWLEPYNIPTENKTPVTVGIIMAGNIPLAGFHDLLCILITGNKPNIKYSHSDTVLMQFLITKLKEKEPGWNELLSQVYLNTEEAASHRFPIGGLDAVIATGSNNSAKHFEYYFKQVPHVVRKNRNSAAVLDGSETAEELSKLGTDIFSYFGLGCRNISKLYVPEGYDFSPFFRNIEKFGKVIEHHKYANNYLYNRTVYLMDGVKFTDNNFLLLTGNQALASPVAVVHFEYYKDNNTLGESLNAELENIQCIATNESLKSVLISSLRRNLEHHLVDFGQTQSPTLVNYADGVDIVNFLLNISNQGKKEHPARTA